MTKRFEICRRLAPALGFIALLLGLALRSFGYDDTGLLRSGYFAAVLLPIVAIAGIVIPVAAFWGLRPKGKYNRVFPASPIGAAGIACAAIGLLADGVLSLSGASGIYLAKAITGILAGIALGWAAWCRYTGQRPTFLLFAVATVHLMLRLICGYQSWSRESQVLPYLYPLLATVCVMFALYEQTAADAGIGNLKSYLVTQLAGLFLCIGAVGTDGSWLFYLTMAGWLGCTLFSIRLPNPRTAEQAEQPQQPQQSEQSEQGA